ncbi:Dephospho-CoA kinase, partial [Dissostichus eleginoides]
VQRGFRPLESGTWTTMKGVHYLSHRQGLFKSPVPVLLPGGSPVTWLSMALFNPAGEQSDTAEVDLIEHISKGSGSYYNQITVN